ncbi:MAG: peptidoglycan-binding protein LysM [Albidovulum sp.]|jgi:nucleoid-associated protein YgaU
MGVWSFVKGAGKKLFGSSAEAAEVPAEEALKAEIEGLGLDAKGLDIKVQGDKVVVSGTAVSQEMKEKVILAVGNVNGVAEVEDDDVAGATPVFHTVAKGDTLSAIAKKTLGNANRYPEIFEANKPMLTHPDKIYPGQVLRIPAA